MRGFTRSRGKESTYLLKYIHFPETGGNGGVINLLMEREVGGQ